MLAAAMGVVPCRADVAQSLAARIEGRSTPTNGALLAGGQTIESGNLISVVRSDIKPAVVEPNRIRLRNGEVWPCYITRLENDTLYFKHILLGSRVVAVSNVLSIEFTGKPDAGMIAKPMVFYRTRGEPVPGALVWFDAAKVLIESPLGMLSLLRDEAIVYRYSGDLPADEGLPEIGFTDGTILRAEIKFLNDKLALSHPVMGSLETPWTAVRFLNMHPRNVHRLPPPDIQQVVRTAWGLPPPPPMYTDFSKIFDVNEPPLSSLRSLVLFPKTIIAYPVPKGATAFIASAEGHGDLPSDNPLVIRIDGKTVFQATIDGTNRTADIAIPQPAGMEMTIEAGFPQHSTLPCSVELKDAFFVVQ